MQKLPVLGQIAPTPPPPPATPLRSTELGAFRYGSKLEKRIVGKVGAAVGDYGLLDDGDRVMVCVSGGKDSYALLDVLLLLARKSPVRYSLIAVNVDQGWPGYQTEVIEAHLRDRGVEHRMVRAHEIAGIVERVLRPEETGATPCSLCSRLRRGVIYGLADELGATKIALGHHLDDLAETLLLNLFYSGSLRSMPPKLTSDDGKHVVIRPLAYVEERDLVAYAEERRYPTVRCSCPTCGLPDQQRQVVKRMLSSLESEHAGLKTQMLAAMKNVKPLHLLDQTLLLRAPRVGASEAVPSRPIAGGVGPSQGPTVSD
jgi:tRNA 2-thiocytidine biosynthesis protein TtcA